MPKHKFIEFIAIISLLLASSLIGCGASDAGDIVFRQSAVEQEVSGAATTGNEQELAQNQGVLGELEFGSDEQDTQENSWTSGNNPEPETSKMLAEETDDLYYFGPISYDLSNLPAMENENYTEWNGKCRRFLMILNFTCMLMG